MKRFLLVIILLSSSILFAQTPNMFNYQGVLRNSSGELVKNTSITVKITLLQGSISGTVVYSESHIVGTNNYGQFAIQIGGGAIVSGTYNTIDWSQQLYQKTEIANPSGGTLVDMGTTQLISVPYSNYSGKAKVLDNNLLYFTDSDTLFAVKDRDGNIVFAVFPDGAKVYTPINSKGRVGGFAVSGRTPTKLGEEVEYFIVTPDSTRIYVNDSTSGKGKVGGFAISGRTPTKGVVNDYLFVTPDSTRVYINDTSITKGRVGGFAISGRTPTKEGINVNDYFKVSGSSEVDTFESSPRILWYPKKEAFLTGRVLVESPDSIGTNSMATGFESKAIGDFSQAMGYNSYARGDYSTAIGKNAIANKINSFAFGEDAFAKNEESYAIGKGAIASGYRSFAFGSAGVDTAGNVTGVSQAIGDYSFTFGQGSVSIGKGSFSLGILDTVSGDFSLAMGYRNVAVGFGSVSMGYNNFAGGYNYYGGGYKIGYTATAIGYYNTATGVGSTALGYYTSATADYATTMGNRTTAKGWSATAMGNKTTAIGLYSLSTGSLTTAYGSISVAMGYHTYSDGLYSVTMGSNTKSKPVCSLAIGQYNDTTCTQNGSAIWTSTDPLFICGNGSSTVRSNALTLYKNGNMTISGTLTQNSDKRLKNNIRSIDGVMDKLLNINPVYYEFIDQQTHPSGQQLGLIAQEIAPLFPELVSQDVQGYLSVDYSRFTAVLLQAIKDQHTEIENIKSENDELKTRLSKIEEYLRKLGN